MHYAWLVSVISKPTSWCCWVQGASPQPPGPAAASKQDVIRDPEQLLGAVGALPSAAAMPAALGTQLAAVVAQAGQQEGSAVVRRSKRVRRAVSVRAACTGTAVFVLLVFPSGAKCCNGKNWLS